MERNILCAKCNMPVDLPVAYKCDVCGAEAERHDSNHVCGSSHCMVKCSGCGQAEKNCNC